MTDSRQVDPLSVALDNKEAFDEAVHGEDSLPFASSLRLVTKDKGTTSGRAIGCLTFLVELPDGTIKRAQIVTTIKLLKMALRILEGRYDDDGRSRVEVTGAN